jgi:hypothetical protein
MPWEIVVIALLVVSSLCLFSYDAGLNSNERLADITESVLDTLAEGNYIKYHIDETGEMVLEQIEKNEDNEV